MPPSPAAGNLNTSASSSSSNTPWRSPAASRIPAVTSSTCGGSPPTPTRYQSSSSIAKKSTTIRQRLGDASPRLHALTYTELLAEWEKLDVPWIAEHIAQLQARYSTAI